MKTKLMKYFGIVALLTIMTSLTSCEVSFGSWYDDDDYSEYYYRTTQELCSRTWQDSWTQDGKYYTQLLDFYEDRTGTDIMRVEHRNGYVTEDRYEFKWKWDNSSQTCIRMSYGSYGTSYFEDVWMGSNTLRGILDDVDVKFTGIR
ncbi:hypothetical protein [Phocaeicola sp.]